MSLQAMLAVKQLRGVTPAARIILYAFADYADRGGASVWPSLATIAAECEIDERTARRIVRRLEDSGLLRRGDLRGTAPHATYSYVLTFVQGGHSAPGGRGGAAIPPDPLIRSSSDDPSDSGSGDEIRISGSGGTKAPPAPPHRLHGEFERVIKRT